MKEYIIEYNIKIISKHDNLFYNNKNITEKYLAINKQIAYNLFISDCLENENNGKLITSTIKPDLKQLIFGDYEYITIITIDNIIEG